MSAGYTWIVPYAIVTMVDALRHVDLCRLAVEPLLYRFFAAPHFPAPSVAHLGNKSHAALG